MSETNKVMDYTPLGTTLLSYKLNNLAT